MTTIYFDFNGVIVHYTVFAGFYEGFTNNVLSKVKK